MKIGQRLRTIRLERKWTMDEIAKTLDLPWSTYKSYEYGFRSPSRYVASNLDKWCSKHEKSLGIKIRPTSSAS